MIRNQTTSLDAQQAVRQLCLAPQVGRDDQAALPLPCLVRETSKQVSRGASVQSFGRLVQ
mgnify:CR=1 FL=1